jgi:hypothetical protein
MRSRIQTRIRGFCIALWFWDTSRLVSPLAPNSQVNFQKKIISHAQEQFSQNITPQKFSCTQNAKKRTKDIKKCDLSQVQCRKEQSEVFCGQKQSEDLCCQEQSEIFSTEKHP